MRRYFAVLVLLTGCDLYFGDEQIPPCGGGYVDGYPALELRDPATGECQAFGGGWTDCPDTCGPCPAAGAETGALPPQPDWGACFNECEGLDEQSCLGTSGCYAAYVDDSYLADGAIMSKFLGCHVTAPSGPVQGGGCWNLDAQECSRHDDCALHYAESPNSYPPTRFSQCAPEPTTQGCAAVDCGPGYRCEEQCYPCDGQNGACDPFCAPMCVPELAGCANVDCGPGFTCAEVCDAMDPTTGGNLPPGQCYATCVPTGGGDPGACTGPVSCFANPPACPTGTVPGIANGCWTGYCIPEADCGPNNPGTCEPALCDANPPACPTGTVAGVTNGCYSGYCIPSSQCGPVACETLTTEAECTAQMGCSAVYTGTGCTCDVGGCTCTDLTFARCEPWLL